MKISKLVWREIAYRKLAFLSAVIPAAVTVAACICVITLLRAQQLRTTQHVRLLDDEIRKITKNMGFNIMVFPKALNLADFHASDFAEVTMPQEYVMRLAVSPDVVTVNHLRPALIRKVMWPEQNRQVLLMGVSGVIPFRHRVNKKPLSEPIAPGTMEIGRVLADELQLKVDQEVAIMGETLQLKKIHAPQGNKDDITVWVDLAKAQQWLDLPDRINMIQALECNCATIDRLAEIDQEISGLLGDDIQVVEMSGIAIARAKSRNEVAAAGKAAERRTAKFAVRMFPLAILAAGAVIWMLALANVRERRNEIGILRAIGVRSRQIFTVFLGKAVIVGLLGGTLGYPLGFGVARAVDKGLDGVVPDAAALELTAQQLFQPISLVLVLLLTPMLAAMASWVPALTAATQDPAMVLREE